MKFCLPAIVKIKENGFVLLGAILLFAVVAVVIGVISSLVLLSLKKVDSNGRNYSSLDIAEAGINYYLWHLSHNPSDYKDGNSTPSSPPYGPYTHNYTDNLGNVIGTYTLYITPPPLGSNQVTVKAIGRASGGNENRTIIATLGIPSFAQYSFLSNDEAWFGSNETTDGKVHSNIGIHYDGTGNDIISASQATYRPDPSFGGDGSIHNGVWGTGGPQNLWVYPVPAIDFSNVTADLNSLQTQAQTNGIFLGDISGLGYYLHLKVDGTIDIYRVKNENQNGIQTQFISTQVAPANGILFSTKSLWVDGTWGGRINIIAAKLPDISSTNRSLTIINNLTYVRKDGSAAIGLIAQRDVIVPPYAPSNLEIDAAMLSQKSHVWFPSSNGPILNSISVYGSIETYNFWTWTWVDNFNNVVSGYQTTTLTFDNNLTLAAPPGFPSTGSFAILSWKEQF